jgi:hypothetical protein
MGAIYWLREGNLKFASGHYCRGVSGFEKELKKPHTEAQLDESFESSFPVHGLPPTGSVTTYSTVGYCHDC